ncbi:MAG: hypothetical protein ACXADH_01745 [Candidatus Kariarchaeaceae archaeon]|jgi:hypothetical protein
MHRYMHAWIALRAIDRLDAIADQIQANDPQAVQDYESIRYFVQLLRDKMGLVVEGSWIPDNVIHDNNPGHIWKYEPPLTSPDHDYFYIRNGKRYDGCYVEQANGDRIHYRTDHASTHSLSYIEASNSYAFDKYWRKTLGQLADRTIAVHQMMRDLILFQRDEMLNIVATLVHRYDNELITKKAEVIAFLKDPADMKAYYDEQKDGEYVHRAPIVAIRNRFRMGQRKDDIHVCLQHYGSHIQEHIERLNSQLFLDGKKPVFPMFFTNDQIALTFFSLSHYVADAHMPLHCDGRTFSTDECNNIHYQIENTWDRWLLTTKQIKTLRKNLSETNRCEEFLKIVFGNSERIWNNFTYPQNKKILRDLDTELGNDLWTDRPYVPLEGSGWFDIVGVTYASYCLCSRLLQFDDQVRIIPLGTNTDYSSDYTGSVQTIKGQTWKTSAREDGIEENLDSYPSLRYKPLNELRKKIYQYVKSQGGSQPCFKYLSLLLLIDAVENTARLWAKTITDHLKVPYIKAI